MERAHTKYFCSDFIAWLGCKWSVMIQHTTWPCDSTAPFTWHQWQGAQHCGQTFLPCLVLQVRLRFLTHSNTPSHLSSSHLQLDLPLSPAVPPLADAQRTLCYPCLGSAWLEGGWSVSLVQTRCLLAWPLKYPWKGQGRKCHPGPRVGTEVVTGQWWPAWRHWFCG